jgi:expansin (peptidoglycan-binding protein)
MLDRMRPSFVVFGSTASARRRSPLGAVFACAIMACGGTGGEASSPAAGRVDGGPSGPGPATPFGAVVEDGLITYYDATGAGACGYDPSPTDLDVVALDSRQYQNAAWCGACVKVDGPKGSVTVRVVDECPTCDSEKHLDLSRSAFAKVADLELGRVKVKWQFVSCPVSGPVAFKFKEGSNEWWTAIQVRNHRLPIKSVEANVSGTWRALERVSYGYFVADPGLGKGPYELRVTAIDGKVLTESGVGFVEGGVVSGKGQF